MELFDTDGSQAIGPTWTNINFSTEGIIDAGYTSTANSISVTETGRYRVTYRVTTQVVNNTRTGGEFELLLNGSTVPGSYASTYQRNRDVDRNTINVVRVVDLNVGDELQVRGQRYSSNGDLETVANGSSLLVERLR